MSICFLQKVSKIKMMSVLSNQGEKLEKMKFFNKVSI